MADFLRGLVLVIMTASVIAAGAVVTYTELLAAAAAVT